MPEATVTVTLTYTALDSHTAMAQALYDALPRGWHGTISAMQHDATTVYWALVLNTPTSATPVTCRMGDVLTWDGAQYQALDQATFDERYQSGS